MWFLGVDGVITSSSMILANQGKQIGVASRGVFRILLFLPEELPGCTAQ